MVHDPHEMLPGYDPRQILVDGCQECEHRAQRLGLAFGNMSSGTFAKSWRRAAAWNLDRVEEVGSISRAERPLLDAVWMMQIQLERECGLPLGEIQARPNAFSLAGSGAE